MKKRLLAILLVAIMTVLAAVPAMAAGEINTYESALLTKFNNEVNKRSWLGTELQNEYKTEAKAALEKVDLTKAKCDELEVGMNLVLAALQGVSSLSGAQQVNAKKALDTMFNAVSEQYGLSVNLNSTTGVAKITVSGWQQDSSKNWYYYQTNAPAKGWKKVGASWYFLDRTTGVMKTGWINDSGKWYYATSGGKMVTGWKKIGGKWYYFDPTNKGNNGHMETGWQKIDGYWYYLGKDGAMVTGWQKIGKSWYYMGTNGVVREGWQKIGTAWYYFKPYDSGAMMTGWQNINGKWYYLGTNGVMATGWKYIGSKWYYFFGGSNGSMATGWQKIGGTWYYFKPGNSGQMVTGTQTINGKTYTFDANGAWIG